MNVQFGQQVASHYYGAIDAERAELEQAAVRGEEGERRKTGVDIQSIAVQPSSKVTAMQECKSRPSKLSFDCHLILNYLALAGRNCSACKQSSSRNHRIHLSSPTTGLHHEESAPSVGKPSDLTDYGSLVWCLDGPLCGAKCGSPSYFDTRRPPPPFLLARLMGIRSA